MPNNVTNIITISDTGGTSIEEIRAAFINESTNKIDFNIVAQSPKCLDYFQPHTGIINTAQAILEIPVSDNPLLGAMQTESRARALEEQSNLSEPDKKDVQRAIENYEECGYCYWYDWQAANWGTKWNAYEQPEDGFPMNATEFTFDTAWSHPFNIIEAITKKLPNVTFKIQYADEDLGSNVGRYLVKNDTILSEDIAPDYKEMNEDQKAYYMEMAWNLKHPDEDPASWGYDENWEYHDEIYDEYNK